MFCFGENSLQKITHWNWMNPILKCYIIVPLFACDTLFCSGLLICGWHWRSPILEVRKTWLGGWTIIMYIYKAPASSFQIPHVLHLRFHKSQLYSICFFDVIKSGWSIESLTDIFGEKYVSAGPYFQSIHCVNYYL